MKRIAGLLIMASVLTGCGNTAAKPAQPTLNKDFQTMGDLVSTLRDKGIECTYTKSSDVLIVLEEGNCSVNGKDVTIDLFPSDASAKQTLDAYGSLAGGYTFADYNWIMNTDDSATAKAMSETLGLKVKT